MKKERKNKKKSKRKTPKQYRDARREAVCLLRAGFLSVPQIAEKVGLTVAAVWKYARTEGIELPGRAYSEKVRADANRRLAGGERPAAIAAALGMTPATVVKWAKEAGVPIVDERHYPLVLKEEACRRLGKGERPKDIAAAFGVNVITLYRWRRAIKGESGPIRRRPPKPRPPAAPEHDLLSGYRRELERVRCAPKGTVINYTRAVRDFLKSNLPITAAGVKEHIANLAMGPRSKQSMLTGIKSWARWLAEAGLLTDAEEARIFRISPPQAPRSPRRGLTQGQIGAILQVKTPVSKKAWNPEVRQLRDTALIALCRATGLRVSELVSLDIDCLRKSKEEGIYHVDVVRKKGGTGPAFADEEAHAAVVAYLLRRSELAHPRTKYLDPRALFVGSLRGNRLNTKEAYLIVSRRGKVAGVRAFPHALRHSFATHLDQSGATTRDVQELMGHRSIVSTMVYINPNAAHLAEVYAKYHPPRPKDEGDKN
jgi:site-specific recombinase XerD/DNA invertase Pin-like site-specific DNA recombinase